MLCDRIIESHPEAPVIDAATLCAAIEGCVTCAQACAICADACLAEPDPGRLAACIRLDLDCADLCQVAARIASRQPPSEVAVLARVLELAALALDLCATECERHVHEHCRLCAEACRVCEEACQRAIQRLPGAATRPVIPSMAH
jgi:hypothetical protein